MASLPTRSLVFLLWMGTGGLLAAQPASTPEKPEPTSPSEYRLTGTVEDKVARFNLTFTISTEFPNTRVYLGCGGSAKATRASLDNKVPFLETKKKTDVGWKPGLYAILKEPCEGKLLELEVDVPLTHRGMRQEFAIELPATAITAVSVELPAGAMEVQVGEVDIDKLGVWQLSGRKLTGRLGIEEEELRISWREAKYANPPPAPPTSEGQIDVRINAMRQVETRAVLELIAKGGATKMWQVLTPRNAELRLPIEQEALLDGAIETAQHPAVALHTIRLREPRSEPLTLTITVPPSTPFPRRQLESIGPFSVLGAVRQTGRIVVINLASNLQLQLHPRGDTLPREITSEEEKLGVEVHGFKYDRVFLPKTKLDQIQSANALSLLDVEAQTIRGQLETRLRHVLSLVEPVGQEKRHWQVLTTIQAQLIQPGIESLEVQLPTDCSFVPLPEGTQWPHPVLEAVEDPEKNVVQFKLARDGWKSFSLTIEGRYQTPVTDQGVEQFALPRPLETVMGTPAPMDSPLVVLANESVELLNGPAVPNGVVLARTAPNQLNWQPPLVGPLTFPESVSVRWQPYRQEISVLSTVDLTLTAREAYLRHVLLLRFARAPAESVQLVVPPQSKARLAVSMGGNSVRTLDDGEKENLLSIAIDPKLAKPGAPNEIEIVLDYSYLLPENVLESPDNEGFRIPLIRVAEATLEETQVRVWRDLGALPRVVNAEDWSEDNIEEVPGIARLPSLNLRSHRLGVPLELKLDCDASLAKVLVKRSLIRVRVDPGKEQRYRASFLVSQLLSRHMDVELPVPIRIAELVVTLDGKQVDPQIVDKEGEVSESGRIARLHLSSAVMRPYSLLEVSYALNRSRAQSGTLWTTFSPPILRNATGPTLTRWEISLPGDWVPFWPEEGAGAKRNWFFESWLLTPRPEQDSRTLDRWLKGDELAGVETTVPAYQPNLVSWQSGTASLTVLHAPRRAWLMVCSLAILVFGFGLTLWWRRVLEEEAPAFWLGTTLTLLFIAVVVAYLIWPTTVSMAFYGGQIGLAITLAMGILQWGWYEQRRRRILYLPNFRREQEPETSLYGEQEPGSSANGKRAPSSQQPAPKTPRQPSTVDAPSPGSSLRALLGSSVEQERRSSRSSTKPKEQG